MQFLKKFGKLVKNKKIVDQRKRLLASLSKTNRQLFKMTLFFKLLIFNWLYRGSEDFINSLKLTILIKLCFEHVESYQMFHSEFVPKFDMDISYECQEGIINFTSYLSFTRIPLALLIFCLSVFIYSLNYRCSSVNDS